MRWRSINTPHHQVQGSATRIQQKTSAPDALYVAPDALRRVSGTTLTASCTSQNSSHRTPFNRPVSSRVNRSVRDQFCNPLWVRDWTHPIGSGACARCLTLGTRRAGSPPAYTGRANSHTVASGATTQPKFRRSANFPKQSLIFSI